MSRWLQAALEDIDTHTETAAPIVTIGTIGTATTNHEHAPILIPHPGNTPFGMPSDPSDWAEWINERSAILEFDGKHPREKAEMSAYHEALEAWCGQHWTAPAPCQCAACNKPSPGFSCGDGAKVCDMPNYTCLIQYGTTRKKAAVDELRRAGINPPKGYTLPNGQSEE